MIKNHSKIFFLMLLAVGLPLPAALAQSGGSFAATGNLSTPRASHSATLLQDGRVLIAGGVNHSANGTNTLLASAELYDPSTGTFTPTGNMTIPRAEHIATLLPNGTVLIAGGSQTGRTAELYDPKTGVFSATGNMVDGSQISAAALLPDGKVLFDGTNNHAPFAQVYDPATGMFTATGSPSSAPILHSTAISLADGRVLLTQDNELRAELYDPATSTFTTTQHAREPFLQGPATVLLNGQVLFAGGIGESFDGWSATAEVYDPATQVFAQTGNMTTIRNYHTVTLLTDGTALVAGGDNGPDVISTTNLTELYDPASRTFTRGADMVTSRERHTATLLRSGKVLLTGGAIAGMDYGDLALASAELYSPASVVPAPALFSLSGNGQGQGAIWHSAAGVIVSTSNPAIAGEVLSMYTTSLGKDTVAPPQVFVGGKLAQVLFSGPAPGYAGYYQVNFRVPSGIAAGPAIPVFLSFLGRTSNLVTTSLQ